MNKPNESKIQLKHELDNSIRDIAEKVKNLNDYNTELKTENNDLKLTLKSNDKKLNEIDETHKIQVIQLEKTNMKLTCNLTMLKEENKKLKTDLDNLLKARHRHRQEIDNIIKEKNMIQTALNEMTANNVKLESAITQLESERKALNRYNFKY
jgi:chromosome segregation ATPase